MILYFYILQVAVPAATLLMFWNMLVKPWRREGRMTVAPC